MLFDSSNYKDYGFKQVVFQSGTQRNPPFDLDDLRMLAHTQPLVHQALTAYDYGNMPLEQVLIGLVLVLSEQLESTQQVLESALKRQMPPIILDVPAGLVDELRAWHDGKRHGI